MTKPLSIEDVALLCGSNVTTISAMYLRGELTGWCRVPGGFVSSHEARQLDPVANANAVQAERNAADHFVAGAIRRGEASDAAARKAEHDANVAAAAPYVKRIEAEQKQLAANAVAAGEVRIA